jgi:hypothetical protein
MSSLVCVGCGCSERKACILPDDKFCAWASFNPPLCTRCRDEQEAATANLHSDTELAGDAKRLAELLDDELPEGVAFLVFCFTPQKAARLVGLSNAKIEHQVAAARAWLAHADRASELTRQSDPIQVLRLRNYLLEYQTPDRSIGPDVGDVVDAAIQRMVEITNQYLDLSTMYRELRDKTTPPGERRSDGGIILP